MAIMTAPKSNAEAYLNAIKDNDNLLKIIVDRSNQTSGKVKCELLLQKMLSMVDQMKKDLKMSKWLHMPKTSIERVTMRHRGTTFLVKGQKLCNLLTRAWRISNLLNHCVHVNNSTKRASQFLGGHS